MKNKISSFVLSMLMLSVSVQLSTAQPGYVVGDFHQHTTFSDGSYSFFYMAQKDCQYKLDWWANSEHGGAFNRNAFLSGYDLLDGYDANGNNQLRTTYWDTYSPAIILGNSNGSGHMNMWRWQSLRDYSYLGTQIVRNMYPKKVILQSYEMNVPGHEHCSLGCFTNQFSNNNANALAEFEFRFDANDKDTIGGLAQGWSGKNFVNDHAKAIEAFTWLQNNHKKTSYAVIAHPERKQPGKGGYLISDFRDFNNAAPDVCVGFESVPGHQKEGTRGGYTQTAIAGGTYGGSGYFSARVGGLWDAMLSEGRRFWLFSNSDCHDTTDATGGDFFPGEYQKTYSFTSDKSSPQAIVDGMKSGNVWVVTGDLIDSLEFFVENAKMGETANIASKDVTITVRFHEPSTPNHNVWSSYNTPHVDHFDIIAGELGSLIEPNDPKYRVDTVRTTSVIARFDKNGNTTDSKGLISKSWTDDGNGWKTATLHYTLLSNMYFRLRGTNLGLGVTNETDGAGNPLCDTLVGGYSKNDRIKAFSDLWFYSNPINVKSKVFTTIMNEEPEVHSINVYPNPTNSYVNIECPTRMKLNISDVNGNLIMNEQLNAGTSRVDISNFANGVYFFELSADNVRKVEKIVK